MRVRVLSALAVGALTLGLASPALAADAANPWMNGFPAASAINADLGAYSTPPRVEITGAKSSWYICGDLKAKPTINLVTAMYETEPVTPSSVRADARVYASPAKAKAAFDAIAKNLTTCAGSQKQEAEPGSQQTWTQTVKVGSLTNLTATGPHSMFVYTVDVPTPGSKAGVPLGSQYEVLTLVGNTILDSTTTVTGVTKLTPAQRRSSVSFARAFAASWAAVNP